MAESFRRIDTGINVNFVDERLLDMVYTANPCLDDLREGKAITLPCDAGGRAVFAMTHRWFEEDVSNWGFRQYEKNPIISVVFALLPVGKRVYPHVDDPAVYNRKRYHLCLRGEYAFRSENDWYFIKPGDMFWFDNSKIHEVRVIGDIDRITMIVDCENDKT